MPNEGQFETSRDDREFVEKAWGVEEIVVNDPAAGYCGKILWIKPGWMCSLHYHPVKTETFMAHLGTVGVEYWPNGPEGKPVLSILRSWSRDALHLPAGTVHRFWAMGEEVAALMEFSTAHSDDDVVRLEPSKEIENS